MIHYINGKPHQNIKLNKTKRHALPAYRHNEQVKKRKDFAQSALITLIAGLIMLAVYLVKH